MKASKQNKKGSKRRLDSNSNKLRKKRKKKKNRKMDFETPDRDVRGFREKTSKTTVFGASINSLKKCDIYDSPAILLEEEFRDEPRKDGDPCRLNFFQPGCPPVKKSPETKTVGGYPTFNINKSTVEGELSLKDECESMDGEDDEDNTTTAMNGVVPENPDNYSDSSFDNAFKSKKLGIPNKEDSESEDDPWGSEDNEENVDEFDSDPTQVQRVHTSVPWCKSVWLHDTLKSKPAKTHEKLQVEAKTHESRKTKAKKPTKLKSKGKKPKKKSSVSIRPRHSYKLRSRKSVSKEASNESDEEIVLAATRSRFVGLTFDKNGKRFVGQGVVDGKRKHFASGKSETECARKVRDMVAELKACGHSIHNKAYGHPRKNMLGRRNDSEFGRRKSQAGKKLKAMTTKVAEIFPKLKEEPVREEDSTLIEEEPSETKAEPVVALEIPEPTATKEDPIVIEDHLEPIVMKEEPSEPLDDIVEGDEPEEEEEMNEEPSEPLDDIVEGDEPEEEEMKEEPSEPLNDIVEGDEPEEEDEEDMILEVDEPVEKTKKQAKPEIPDGARPAKMEEEDYDNPFTDEEEEESVKDEVLESHVEEKAVNPLKKEPFKEEQPVVQKEKSGDDDDPWNDEVVQPESVTKAEEEDDPWADDDDDPWAKQEDEIKVEADPEDDFEEPLVKPTKRNHGKYPVWRRRITDRVPDGRRRYAANARSWCAEEEEMFWLCLARFGMDFTKISDRLPGKKTKSGKKQMETIR